MVRAFKYQLLKWIAVGILLFFSCLPCGAQYQDPPDTTIVDDDEADDYLEEEPTVSSSEYFLDKTLQYNGGGPDSLQVRTIPDTAAKQMLSDEDFWYVNYEFEKKKKKEARNSVPFTESTSFQTLLWLIIIGGFAAFVVIYLANSNVGLFRRKNKPITSTDDGVVELNNIFEINYQREIDKAVAAGNYRLAVRLMFLRLLRNLADRKVIQYQQDRTNFDYLLQLHPTRYYDAFFRLTRNYEYSWYGQFALDADKFAVIRRDFESFDQSMNIR